MKVKAKLKALGLIERMKLFLEIIHGSHSETINHLVFQCEYSKKCCELLSKHFKTQLKPTNIEDGNRQIMNVTRRFKKQVRQNFYMFPFVWNLETKEQRSVG